MWKKDQEEMKIPEAPPREIRESSASKVSRRMGYIGESIIIKGGLSGNEDLTIDGRVEGKIELKDHNLTIGGAGRVFAEIFAKSVTITGEVNGNVRAEERIEITNSGKVKGDLLSPRITIADGAQFKGSVDMASCESTAYDRSGLSDEVLSEKQS